MAGRRSSSAEAATSAAPRRAWPPEQARRTVATTGARRRATATPADDDGGGGTGRAAALATDASAEGEDAMHMMHAMEARGSLTCPRVTCWRGSARALVCSAAHLISGVEIMVEHSGEGRGARLQPDWAGGHATRIALSSGQVWRRPCCLVRLVSCERWFVSHGDGASPGCF